MQIILYKDGLLRMKMQPLGQQRFGISDLDSGPVVEDKLEPSEGGISVVSH